MVDWLELSTATSSDITMTAIGARLCLSTIAGLAVAAISQFSHGHRKSDAIMRLTTLVLLTVLIAMVTQVIGNSVARAFGLVGALSIVRFRTVVDDTRDTAFVIFAVTVGMAIGAGVWQVPAVGIPLVGLLAVALDRQQLVSSPPSATHSLKVRLGLGRDPHEVLHDVFERHLVSRSITAIGTARQGAAIEITYEVTLRDPDSDNEQTALIVELNRVEGLQSAELSQL